MIALHRSRFLLLDTFGILGGVILVVMALNNDKMSAYITTIASLVRFVALGVVADAHMGYFVWCYEGARIAAQQSDALEENGGWLMDHYWVGVSQLQVTRSYC